MPNIHSIGCTGIQPPAVHAGHTRQAVKTNGAICFGISMDYRIFHEMVGMIQRGFNRQVGVLLLSLATRLLQFS